MISLDLGRVERVLLLGAHSDDIEIGCGGTVLQMAARAPNLEVRWVVFSAPGIREREARESANEFLAGVVRKDVGVASFRESYFPSEWPAIKEHFEEIKSHFAPDLVFTHRRDDRHQDHRVISDLTWNTFRNHLVLEYEIPKYDGDLGTPNLFVPLEKSEVEKKTGILMRHFLSQQSKHWFTSDLFQGLMRMRGIECGAPFAEAFHGRKIVLQSTP